jgi:putative ABC transport system substrate-binding protein
VTKLIDGVRERGRYPSELVGATSDLIVAGNKTSMMALNQEIRIPIVFVQSNDPVAQGFVASFARPGGQP